MEAGEFFGVCLLLIMFSSASNADSSCPSMEGGSATMEEAMSSGAIVTSSHCMQQFSNKDCSSEMSNKYRTADGSCNHADSLGTANSPFKRLLLANYSDVNGAPRSLQQDGSPLTSPTDISRVVIEDVHRTFNNLTVLFMAWGQFIDHDLTLTPVSMGGVDNGVDDDEDSGSSSEERGGTGTDIKCCGPNREFLGFLAHPQCFPMKLSVADADTRFQGNCMDFVRSIPASDSSGSLIEPREQLNILTPFLDSSNIYGSSQELQDELRAPLGAGLDATLATSAGNLLPNNNADTSCIIEDQFQGIHFCFLAGDERVNEQPGLTSMHTMGVRLHNYVVDELTKLNNGWSEDTMFQEARRIVVAIYQNIQYSEYLPLVLGDQVYQQYGLAPGQNPSERTQFDSGTDPRIASAFATAAYRFGHTHIPQHLLVGNTRHRFMDLFFRPALIFNQFDDVVGSLVKTSPQDAAEDFDPHMVVDVTDHLFEPADQVDNAPSHGFDLAALNIQRGRDHGLPPYNRFRELCGLEPIEEFSDLSDDLEDKLASVYGSVDDIDLFVGGLLETPEPGGDVGPTFACIIAQQFQDLKRGDRFFYERPESELGFTDDQLSAIRQIRVADVLCLTTALTEVPNDAYRNDGNVMKQCQEVPSNFLDFSLWSND